MAKPRPPWYHAYKHLYQPLQHRYKRLISSESITTSFLLLELPLELRNQIYLHVRHGSGLSVQVSSKWSIEKKAYGSYTYSAAATRAAEHDAAPCITDSRQLARTEDDASYLRNNNDFFAMHGSWPPTNLLLVSKRINEEVRDAFGATAAFEIHR